MHTITYALTRTRMHANAHARTHVRTHAPTHVLTHARTHTQGSADASDLKGYQETLLVKLQAVLLKSH